MKTLAEMSTCYFLAVEGLVWKTIFVGGGSFKRDCQISVKSFLLSRLLGTSLIL